MRLWIETKRYKKGFSLIDALVAAVILIVGVLGTMMYRYHSTLDIRKANEQFQATTLAVTLSETWRGLGGSETFDPIVHFHSHLDITSDSDVEKPEDFTLLGGYQITVDNKAYTATLSYKDTISSLRTLNISIEWPLGNSEIEKEFEVTTYAAN